MIKAPLRKALLALTIIASVVGQSTPGYSRQDTDWQGLVDLLKLEQFQALEDILTALQREYEAGKKEEWVINRAFHSFAYSDPELLGYLDEWVRREPSSYAALMARGVYSWHLAWLSRGEDSAGATHPMRFAAMQKFSEAARIDVEAAVGLNNRIVKGHQVLMNLATINSARIQLWQRYLAGASEAPTANALHIEMLWALQPEWGGFPLAHRAFKLFVTVAAWFKPQLRSVRANIHYQEAQELNWQSQTKLALSLNEAALHLHDAAYLRRQRARIHFAANQESAGFSELNKAAELHPEDSYVQIALGRVLSSRRRFENALPHLDDALKTDPYHPNWLIRRSRVKSELDDVEGAAADLLNALVFGNYDPEVHAANGWFIYKQRSDMRRSAQAFRRATELAPYEANYWRGYSSALSALKDCEIIPVTRRYNEICKETGECTQDRVASMVIAAARIKLEQGCAQEVTPDHIDPRYEASSDIRQISFLDLRLGDPLEKVKQRFDSIEVRAEPHPGDADDKLYEYRGKFVSEDGATVVRTTSSHDGRLMSLNMTRSYKLEETLTEIRDRLIDKFGEPDDVYLGGGLRMEYKRTNSSFKTVARFTIRVRVLRANYNLCLLSDHLRDGSTIARTEMILIDNEAIKTNTNAVWAKITNWRVDAIQRQEANNAMPLPRDAASGC